MYGLAAEATQITATNLINICNKQDTQQIVYVPKKNNIPIRTLGKSVALRHREILHL